MELPEFGKTVYTGIRAFSFGRFGPESVVCLRHSGEPDALNGTWARLLEYADQRRLLTDRTTLIGVLFDDPDTTPPDLIRYDACVTVLADWLRSATPGEPGEPVGLRFEELAACSCWCTTYQGPYDGLAGAYRDARAVEAFSRAGVPAPLGRAPYYEKYLSAGNLPKAGSVTLQVYLPIAA